MKLSVSCRSSIAVAAACLAVVVFAAPPEDIGTLNPKRGDAVEGAALYNTDVASLFDGNQETGCSVRQGSAILRIWAQPVTITQVDVRSYLWPADKTDNKWIYNYRISVRDGDGWRRIAEFGGDDPLNPPEAQKEHCRSGRGYFAGHVRHTIETGGLPVITTAIRIEVLKAYGNIAVLREIGVSGFRTALEGQERDALTKDGDKPLPTLNRSPAATPPAVPAPIADRILLTEGAECPADLRGLPALFITGAFPNAVSAVNPPVPSMAQASRGGADAGMPGDSAAFRISRMAIGKQYYRTPDAVTVTLDTSELQGDIWLDMDYMTSQYGTTHFTVLLGEDLLIGQFDCTSEPHGRRQAGGRIPRAMLPSPRATITFREARGVYYAVIDSIQLRGSGLALIDAGGERLDAVALMAKQEARTPHLPVALSVPEGWRGFDFGTMDSPVWEAGGCAAVTGTSVYSAARGFGWIPTDVAIRAGTIADADALRGDYNACQSDADREELCSFRIDLPNGDYELLIVSGLAPHDAKTQRPARLAISGGQELVFPFFGRKDMLLDRQSVHHRRASAHVTDGSLLLQWTRGNYMIINGLFLWPESAQRQGRVAATAIVEDYYLPVATEVKPGARSSVPTSAEERARLQITDTRLESTSDVDRTLPLEVSVPIQPAWRKRGFLLFQRDYDRPVYPYSVPTADDRWDASFAAAAALGEHEPWQLALHALQDLQDVALAVSPFRHRETGATLPAERFDVRMGVVIKEGVITSQGGQYVRIAKPLVPVAPQSVAAGDTALYWITVHVPLDAVPGLYQGHVTVRLADGTTTAFPMELAVRPFTLRPPPIPQGMFWSPRHFPINPDKQIEVQLADMASHGLRTVVLYSTEGAPEVAFINGRAVFNYSRVENILGLLKKHAFTGPIPVFAPQSVVEGVLPQGESLDTDMGRQALADLMRGMVTKYREYGFDVYFYPVDEPSSSGASFEAAKAHLSRMKSVAPECKTFSTCVLGSARALDEWLDIRCHTGLQEGWLQAAEASGDLAWEYGGIYAVAPNASIRLKGGLANVRTGIRGKLYWNYCWSKGSEWFDLDSDQKDAGAVVPSANGPIPIVAYEVLRQGLDDTRYYATLEALVKAKNDAAGRALLREVMDDFDDLGQLRGGAPTLRTLREKMAARIEALSR